MKSSLTEVYTWEIWLTILRVDTRWSWETNWEKSTISTGLAALISHSSCLACSAERTLCTRWHRSRGWKSSSSREKSSLASGMASWRTPFALSSARRAVLLRAPPEESLLASEANPRRLATLAAFSLSSSTSYKPCATLVSYGRMARVDSTTAVAMSSRSFS